MNENFPETATAPKVTIEPPHIHIDVHVHLDGASGGAYADRKLDAIDREMDKRPVAGGSSKRPLLMTVVIAAGLLFVGYAGYRAGVGSTAAPSALATAMTVPETPEEPSQRPTPALPESLARELQQPPQVTPPPGAPANAGAPSGPAAFGLHE